MHRFLLCIRASNRCVCTRHRPTVESVTDSHILRLLSKRTGRLIHPSRRCSDMLRIANAFPRDGQGILPKVLHVSKKWRVARVGRRSDEASQARAQRASYKLGRKVRKIRAESLPASKRERGISPVHTQVRTKSTTARRENSEIAAARLAPASFIRPCLIVSRLAPIRSSAAVIML